MEVFEKVLADRQKHCVYCDELIKFKATFCQHCQKRQNRLMEGLLWFSPVASLIAALSVPAALTLVFYDKLEAQWIRLTRGDNIIALGLKTNGRAVFYNDGYRPVTLISTKFDVSYIAGGTLIKESNNYDVYTLLPRKEIVSVELGDQIRTPGYVRYGDTIDFTIMEKLNSLDVPNKAYRALYVGAVIEEEADYQHVRRARGLCYALPCSATLTYRPVGVDQLFNQQINCVGVIFADSSKISHSRYEDLRKRTCHDLYSESGGKNDVSQSCNVRSMEWCPTNNTP